MKLPSSVAFAVDPTASSSSQETVMVPVRLRRAVTLIEILCSADPEAGIMPFNNYYACFGTTTAVLLDRADPSSGSGHAPTGSSGLFTLWVSYGVADCTDGTSHTIAFSEALVWRPGSGGSAGGDMSGGSS
jgi:Protein of unknown function (DUF1559)